MDAGSGILVLCHYRIACLPGRIQFGHLAEHLDFHTGSCWWSGLEDQADWLDAGAVAEDLPSLQQPAAVCCREAGSAAELTAGGQTVADREGSLSWELPSKELEVIAAGNWGP